MNQPYIFKKQIVSVILVCLFMIFAKLIDINKIVLKVTFFYFLVLISITFTPSFRKYIKYPLIIHTFIYYSPMILPLFCINISIKHYDTKKGIVMGIFAGILLLISNYKHTQKYISSENYLTLSTISFNEFILESFDNIFSVISEELFYRYFLIGFLYSYIGGYSILISTILFVYSHYINRWADIMFNIRSYVYHCITGIVFGLIFFSTKSISGCIISHLIFNSPQFVVLYKRIKNNKKYNTQLFNDYD